MSSAQPEASRFAACTIIAKNYLAMARVLAKSFIKQHPGTPFFVLLLDPVEDRFDPTAQPFQILNPFQLGVPHVESMLFKYDVLEASTAIKPYFLAHLFQSYPIEKLVYLDPDILVLKPLTEISDLLAQHSIVLTPHITTPYADNAKPGDHDILLSGCFNLGFLGLSRTAVASDFLSWWQRKVYHYCVVAFDKGLFVDQRWVDLVPGLFGDCFVLRHPGYNVAYWNLHERRVSHEDGEFRVNGGACYFFHFSGFNPGEPSVVSKHQTRFKLRELGDGKKLFDHYRELVMSEQWNDCRRWRYTYNFFSNGTGIPQSARRYYWSLGAEADALGNPFDWLDEAVRHTKQPPNKVPTSDPWKLPPGVNLSGYIASEKGVGEAARSNLRILQAAGLPCIVNNFPDSGSQNPERLPENTRTENPYSVNLINVNADQIPYFAERNPGYLAGHYNVGYWAWELASFPAEWSGSFGYLDEVWVPSTFVQGAVAKRAPIPVHVVPHSIDPDLHTAPGLNREMLRIPEGVFLFLFFFDFHSFLERKNPRAAIRSFKRAFGDRKDVLLLIKTMHAASDPAGFKALADEADSAHVRIFDKVLSRQESQYLMRLCDCYVSLHRSEGFGLTLAEAMQCAKPVIATGYSGNMDFMSTETAFLVDYRIVPVEKNHGPYKAGSEWAEPDERHAAQLMQHVVEDRKAAWTVGQAAREYVLAKLHPSIIAETVLRRMRELIPNLERQAQFAAIND